MPTVSQLAYLLLFLQSVPWPGAAGAVAADEEQCGGPNAAPSNGDEASWLVQVARSHVVSPRVTGDRAAAPGGSPGYTTSLPPPPLATAVLQTGAGRAQLGSWLMGRAVAVGDWVDTTVLLSCVVGIALLTGLVSAYVLQDSLPHGGAEEKVPPPPVAGSDDRWSRSRARLWPQSAPGVRETALPAICSKLLQQGKDYPLLVPVAPLKQQGAWRVEVLAGHGKSPLLVASLVEHRGRERRAVEISDLRDEKPLASIDSALQLRGAGGLLLGKLEKHETEFMLNESSGRPPRWAVGSGPGGCLIITWKEGGAGSKGRILATVSRGKKTNAELLEVMYGPGVDGVLVLLCALGVIAFDLSYAEHGGGQRDEDQEQLVSVATNPFLTGRTTQGPGLQEDPFLTHTATTVNSDFTGSWMCDKLPGVTTITQSGKQVAVMNAAASREPIQGSVSGACAALELFGQAVTATLVGSGNEIRLSNGLVLQRHVD
mmetsp:Transcript_16593/g.35035  ORF Transcript_16593/g.35035 Transcript_16593/m.35035 type:complete len:486 (+) Transcript_16593:120-1577(+)